MKVRVIPYAEYSAEENMRIDRELFAEGLPTLRFYGWSPPAISFGKYNRMLDEIDFEYCEKMGFEWVTRMTGGKTVFHDKELTYSVVLPAHIFPQGVLYTYKEISEVLIGALDSLGVKCSMKSEKSTSATSVCFSEISSYEVTAKGKKLIGSAQHRNAKTVLQHGSILLSIRAEYWQKIWKNRLTPQVLENRTISLEQLLQPLPSIDVLSNRISEAFCQRFE